MARPTVEQLNLLDLLGELDPPPPLQIPDRIFSYRGRTIADYDARFEQWCKASPDGHFNSIRISHGWHHHGPVLLLPDQCDVGVLSASLRCDHARGCECVGRGGAYMAVCDHCGWHSDHAADETRAVVDGLDHAYPGWRDSPVAPPATFCDNKQKAAWQRTVRELCGDRPAGWPVITDRVPPGMRAVPGRSPWGGYDVAAVSLDQHPIRPSITDPKDTK